MHLFYDLFLFLYSCGIRLFSFFNVKAGEWVQGRKNWRNGLKNALAGKSGKRLWMHCASLGEFEQGRPVLEAWRKQYPDHVVVLTFFSPSGYRHHKADGLADVVAYLPLDGPSASRDFIELVDPFCVLFVKYEFWHYYSKRLHERNTPLFCISAIFRPDQIFFRSYGGFFHRILERYTCLFVQDDNSAGLLRANGIADVLVSGDTRFDRVIQNAKRTFSHPIVDAFSSKGPVLVAGSTWPADEEILLALRDRFREMRFIIAPHETGEERVARLCSRFGADAARLSQITSDSDAGEKIVLVIDSIGLLSALYRYGKYAYVGGGFGAGIHNTLEAAVYGKPVFFGPEHTRFREAVDMISEGCAFSIANPDDLASRISILEMDSGKYTSVAEKAICFVERNAGATDRIMHRIAFSIDNR